MSVQALIDRLQQDRLQSAAVRRAYQSASVAYRFATVVRMRAFRSP